MAATSETTTLEANEKGQKIYTNDVDSSQNSTPSDLDDYPDPDVGKSDEERAKLVCMSILRSDGILIRVGQSSRLEDGPVVDSMAVASIPPFILGPHEYRQCSCCEDGA